MYKETQCNCEKTINIARYRYLSRETASELQATIQKKNSIRSNKIQPPQAQVYLMGKKEEEEILLPTLKHDEDTLPISIPKPIEAHQGV